MNTENVGRNSHRDGGRVLICGAGIAGLTLAWWLERDGWDVVLVEKASGLRDQGYLIDFTGTGYDVAKRMGILPQLEHVQYPAAKILNVNQNGKPVSQFDYKLFKRVMNNKILTIMRGDLERVLYEALPDDIEIRYDLTVDNVEQSDQKVDVGLSDGTHDQVDLLVGADGIHSRVRKLVFGDKEDYSRYLGYHTAAFIFEDNKFRQRLNGEFQQISVAGRSAGFYPIRDGKVATWFAHRAPRKALPSSPCSELRKQFNNVGWIVPDALSHCDQADGVYYDQVSQIEMDYWSRGRVSLVGDACCAVSLLAGQGASMAMGGAYVLARKLRENIPIEESLALYERKVKPEIREKQKSGRRTASFLIPPTKWHVKFRHKILQLSRLPGMYRILRPAVAGTDSFLAEE